MRVGCGVGTPLIPDRMVGSGLSACRSPSRSPFPFPHPSLFLSPAISIFALLSLCPGSFHSVLVLLFPRNSSGTLTRPMHSPFSGHFLEALWSIVVTSMLANPNVAALMDLRLLQWRFKNCRPQNHTDIFCHAS